MPQYLRGIGQDIALYDTMHVFRSNVVYRL